MILCSCVGLSEEEYEQILKNKNPTEEELDIYFIVGTYCGSCRLTALRIQNTNFKENT